MTIIRTVNLTKQFGDFTANNAINFRLLEGEIKAIVGENGAGKSTLMNMLYGLLKPTCGEIFLRDQKVEFHSPADALTLGIGMVHQHFKLAPSLTVYENVLLGSEIHRSIKLKGKSIALPLLAKKDAKERVQALIDSYNFSIRAGDKVKDLSIGAQQKVEILKMLYRDADIIIFDEPTSVLTPQEIESFFTTLRDMKNIGKSIILITHKLKEVMAVSDSVTVIKQGCVVADLATSDTNEVQLAQLMVGRDVLLAVNKEYSNLSDSPVVYEVKNLSTRNDEGVEVVKNVSFKIRAGEVLGLAGVEGNGQSELIAVLTGLMETSQGHVFLKDREVTNQWPRELRDQGLGIIPEDRYRHGLCQQMTIKDNAIAGTHHHQDVCRLGILKGRAIAAKRDNLISAYDVRVSDKDGLVSSLSGGNAQKILIAREFSANPDVLIAAQPTRGVDIGAIEYIHRALLGLTRQGKAILLISSELSEIMCLSDRIMVMYKGEILDHLDAKTATRENIGLLMAGIRTKEEALC